MTPSRGTVRLQRTAPHCQALPKLVQRPPPSVRASAVDPTALERGAQALKTLDSSPNAQKAFEVIKLQELTRQKEIQKEIEQVQAARASAQSERLRTEAEEKRKTIDRQQEQERITAQYKAKLDA